MNSRFHEGAQSDFEEAIRYYQRQQQGLGLRFAKAVDVVVRDLVEITDAGPALYRDSRFRRVQKFSYLVIYRVEGDVIHVLAHDKRNLTYWHPRLAE